VKGKTFPSSDLPAKDSMSAWEAFLQGLFVMGEWRVLLSTIAFSVLLYQLPFWRKRSLPVSPPGLPLEVPPLASPPAPGLPPPPGRFGGIVGTTISKIWNFFINFPLYGLFLSIYLFFVAPVVIKPPGGEEFELSTDYLRTSWPAATLTMMAVYLLTLLPGIGRFFDDLHILTFFGSMPIMVSLYTRETLLNILTSFPLVVIFHPIVVGALLILLKVATLLRERIARGITRVLVIFSRYGGIWAASVEANLATALAPFLFASPIFALFIFIYNTYFRSGAR